MFQDQMSVTFGVHGFSHYTRSTSYDVEKDASFLDPLAATQHIVSKLFSGPSLEMEKHRNTRASLCKRRCLPGRFGTHYQSDDALESRPEGAWLPVASQLYTLSQYFSSLDRMKQWPILCIGHSPERFLFAQPANDTYFMQLESNHRTTTYSLLPHWQPA